MAEDQTRPRLLSATLAESQRTSPVTVVTGSRQTGKTTLVRDLAPDARRRYVTLDDLDVAELARKAPADLVGQAARMTLDEVQRAPDLLLAVKRAVDEDRRPGRFTLTGSASLLLMRSVADSLAGRATYLELAPLTRQEKRGEARAGLWSELLAQPDEGWLETIEASPFEREEWREHARCGGYPVPVWELRAPSDRSHWFAGFVRTYLERDLQDLASIDNLVDFRRFMQAVALRSGTVLNQTELGRDVGVSQPTARRYVNLLETSYQVVRLPAYAVNRTKRLIKSPKVYWTDVGLGMHLARMKTPEGQHLEGLVLSDLLAWRGAQLDPPQLLHWRTTDQKEVDFVIETTGGLIPIEVKATTRPTPGDARHLKLFRSEYLDRTRYGLLLHDGDEVYQIAEGVIAAPWWRVV